MKRVLTAVILIPIVVVALFRAPLWLFALLVLGVALLAAREYFDIAEATGFRPMRDWGYLFLCMVFLAVAISISNTSFDGWPYSSAGFAVSLCAGALVLLSPYLLMTSAMRRESLSQSLGAAAVSLLMLPYIGLTLVLLLPLRAAELGSLYVLIVMLLVWSGDIAAYYAGRAMGKHKLAPRISPGKTWEGTIASMLAAVIIAMILLHEVSLISKTLAAWHLIPQVRFSPPPPAWLKQPLASAGGFKEIPLWFAALLGFSINIAAQVGDLVESALKRGAGMKDSGTLLPGHGGVLDRIDALLFALPVGLLFYAFGMRNYFQLVRLR